MKITELLAEADLDGMVQDPKTGVWSKPDNRPTLERYDVDWAKFKLTISAIGAQRDGLEDFSKVDAVVFLGLIGDPNIKGVYGPVKEFTGPAVFGRTNDSNIKDSGFKDQGIANMRWRMGGINFKNIEEFDIILNHKYVDLASGDLESALTVAHEARHRGLHMICLIPEIMNKVPADLRSEPGTGTWVNKNMDIFMDKFHPQPKPRDSVEHMLIYAVEKGNSSVHPEGLFTTVEELRQWRSWYMTIAAAAKSYVLNIPVPKGSAIELLRKDLDDNKTPKNVSVQVVKVDQNGVTFAAVPKTNTTATTTSTTINPSVGTPTSAPVPASAPSLGAPNAVPKAPSANISWQDIYQANKGVIGGDPNLIRPGQKLTIPGHGEYIVKSGDTLSQIAANQKIKNPVREQDDRVLDQIKRSLR